MPLAAAAAIAGAASLGGAALQSGAASSAAKEQAAASAANLAFENKIYNQANTQLTPTINQGVSAGNELAGLEDIGGNPAQAAQAFDTFRNSTNYNFQLGQGENAIGFANAPALQSSATAKALNNYAQGQAGSALAGYEGLLTGQQNLGANSALGLLGGANTNAAIQANQNNLAAGAAGTAGLVGAGAGSNALSSIAQLINQYSTQSSFGGSGGSALGDAQALGGFPSSASAFAS